MHRDPCAPRLTRSVSSDPRDLQILVIGKDGSGCRADFDTFRPRRDVFRQGHSHSRHLPTCSLMKSRGSAAVRGSVRSRPACDGQRGFARIPAARNLAPSIGNAPAPAIRNAPRAQQVAAVPRANASAGDLRTEAPEPGTNAWPILRLSDRALGPRTPYGTDLSCCTQLFRNVARRGWAWVDRVDLPRDSAGTEVPDLRANIATCHRALPGGSRLRPMRSRQRSL